MKRKKVIKKMYRIRLEIIEEIDDRNRIDEDAFESLVKNMNDFVYGYKVGLSQAAMILLDKIYEYFPEEKEEDIDS